MKNEQIKDAINSKVARFKIFRDNAKRVDESTYFSGCIDGLMMAVDEISRIEKIEQKKPRTPQIKRL